MVVIRTKAGAAQMVAYNLEKEMTADIAGIVAGDDTLFVLAKDEPTESASKLVTLIEDRL